MKPQTVYIVDDDSAVRDSLALLCETAGLRVRCHESAESFLSAWRPERSGCVILDVRMTGMSGPELQATLAERGCHLPVIFLTAHGDVPTSVRAIKAGAADFLTKPVDSATLLDRIQAALAHERGAQARRSALARKRQALAKLTQRERRILALVVSGQSSKAIARTLGISHRTVEVHRAHILQKTGKGTALELARLVAEAELPAEDMGDR